MEKSEPKEQFPFIKHEEEILSFWKANQIFEKSLALREKGPHFNFFEGPPSANAPPGIHHVLARVYKDIICRFKTMQGYFVLRKAGWDTHGLPVEIQIEKALGFKNKDDIEKFGIAAFNQKARTAVWEYKKVWEELTERIGFWLDLKNPYITYDPYYIESEWWILKKIWQKKLLFKDYKVVPYCPRCGTPLSSHEVAQGYETVQDPSVYLKLKLKDREGYLLIWTTTPWTLPSNLGVAVNPQLEYKKFKLNDELIYALNLPPEEQGEVLETIKGEYLVGWTYEPPYDQSDFLKEKNNLYRVWPADFVSAEDGTGLVHLAPYGEDDMVLAKKFNISLIPTVDEKGNFFSHWNLPPEAKGKFVKEADEIIFNDLKNRGLLVQGNLKGTTHEYPFCWRCHSPLIYYPFDTWFIKMSALKDKMISCNEKINWVPSHVKEGRFGEWLRDLRDWALSRKRYWGTPLNIWVCNHCGHQEAIGSIKELKERALAKTQFYFLRHGEAESNILGFLCSWPEKRKSALTPKGRAEIVKLIPRLKRENFDLIVSSDLGRTKETADLIKDQLQCPVIYDERLRETNFGKLNGQSVKDYHQLFQNRLQRFDQKPEGGETLKEVVKREIKLLKELTLKYPSKKILLIGHGDPLWALKCVLSGLPMADYLKISYPLPGQWEKIDFNLPFNDEGELDLHRPYVDEIEIICPRCGQKMKRVPEVIDCWFDSGAMPFSQWHWPFENRRLVDKRIYYPADYISEGMDQTRGWFYTLLAISTLLNKEPAYKNVISLGLVHDEKGNKMSKSLGNVVEPQKIIDRYGVDALRWYFYIINPPGETKNFSEADLLRHERRFLGTLYNVFVFYQTYKPNEIKKEEQLNPTLLRPLDCWLLARLEETKEKVTDNLNHFKVYESARELDRYVDDLSRWYVRRSRRLFQKPKSEEELMNVSFVLKRGLKELSQILAPFCPFLADYLWQNLREEGEPLSVHLSDWPAPQKEWRNPDLILAMEKIRELASEILALRQKHNLKIRQPLKGVYLKMKESSFSKELTDLLLDETNIKALYFDEQLPEPIVLDTEITPELETEGIIRELVRLIQELRQKAGYHPKEKIYLGFETQTKLKDIIDKNKEMLMAEVNAQELKEGLRDKADLIEELETDWGLIKWSLSKEG